jgi:hypothetical protein
MRRRVPPGLEEAQMRKLLVAVLCVVALVTLVGLASADRGGNGKGKGGGSSADAVAASISLDSGDPHFGDVVTFTVTYAPMRDPALVRVKCGQEGQQIYHVAGLASDSFPLAGGQWIGGAAACTADLFYYEWKGMTQEGPYYLAATEFDVSA